MLVQDLLYDVLDTFCRLHHARNVNKQCTELCTLWPKDSMTAEEIKKQYQSIKKRRESAAKQAAGGAKKPKVSLDKAAEAAAARGTQETPGRAGPAAAAAAAAVGASPGSAQDMHFLSPAVQLGASLEDLRRHYASMTAGNAQKLFKALCTAGPGGLDIKGLIERVVTLQLDDWEVNQSRRSSVSALVNKFPAAIAHIGQSCYALAAFPGVTAAPKTGKGRPSQEAAAGAGSSSSSQPAASQAAEAAGGSAPTGWQQAGLQLAAQRQLAAAQLLSNAGLTPTSMGLQAASNQQRPPSAMISASLAALQQLSNSKPPGST